MACFRLRVIDPLTDGFTAQVDFETEAVAEVADILNVDELAPGFSFRLTGPESERLIPRFGLQLSGPITAGELYYRNSPKSFHDEGHTGRELLLMLQGKKPFAAFMDTLSSTDPDIIPESFFAPHVKSGLIARREVHSTMSAKDGERTSFRRVMFAVKGQEWRFEAYLMLWELAGKYGWNAGFEKCEGYLLGYDTDLPGNSLLMPDVGSNKP